MRFYPEYRHSDGHRTRLGDWLLSRLPCVAIAANVVLIGRMGAINNHSFLREPWVKLRKTWG